MTSTASQYVEAVVRRAREPMEPAHFEPDWADQPRRYKVYPGAPEWPLPPGTDIEAGPLAAGLFPGVPGSPDGALPGQATAGPLALESLSALLRQTFGLLTRRLRITGNTRIGDPTWYQDAAWSRGTASGGGLYPLEIYWVSGPSGPLLPGIYYYASARHALRRLLAGDVTGQVHAALPGHPEVLATDQFLLVTVKFWKNSFKYNSFCYHVVTMDLGALLASWQLWNAAAGLPGQPALWFDEEALNRLLNLDTTAESTMAVVPLPPGTKPPAAGPPHPAAVAVRHTERERSRVVLRFPQVEAVHAAAVAASPLPPPAGTIDDARAVPRPPGEAPGISLPAPRPAALTAGLSQALRQRRSSFGAFSGHPALGPADASTLLAAAAACGLRCDAGGAAVTRLAVFVNHVEGIAAGAYDYRPEQNQLTAIPGPPTGMFLQRHYFLDNYNLEQAAMVVAVIARPAAVISAVGDRGYRLVNAATGAIAQALYLAAAACGVGCGAVLGFDNVAIAERLGFAATDERALLLIMVGPERQGAADFDFRLA
ncbi:MAG: SagB family peptide dehydrogenase [Streptosporangiaceae bacterium]|jgi:SagB-type dehydrogenase family enzyme